LPNNSSLSVTLDQDHLRSTTTSRCDDIFERGDRLWVNGHEETIKPGERTSVCITELRGLREVVESKDPDLPKANLFACRAICEKLMEVRLALGISPPNSIAEQFSHSCWPRFVRRWTRRTRVFDSQFIRLASITIPIIPHCPPRLWIRLSLPLRRLCGLARRCFARWF